MIKKLSDREKVERITPLISKALYKIEYSRSDKNIINAVTKDLCDIFAITQADKADDFMIENVSVQLWLKVNGIRQEGLPFTDPPPGNDYELKPRRSKEKK